MARTGLLLLGCAFLVLLSSFASCEVVEYTFHVHDVIMRRICEDQLIIAVNESFPGPTINAHEGDTVVVHVVNDSPYNLTIHWHGIFQKLNCWQDGPAYITQCPIPPWNNYTYRYDVVGQEGTLWWHAHSNFLRATIHGALIIRPKAGRDYPFPKPYDEVPILLGEWFNNNVMELEEALLVTGNGPNYSDGYTINGWPGIFYPCSSPLSGRRFLDEPTDSPLKLPSGGASIGAGIYKLKVTKGKTYLLRIINAALHEHMFFKIANHNLTVVAVDAVYVNPYHSDLVVLSSGQTVDALLTTDQPSGSYYMAAMSYHNEKSPRPVNNPMTTGILVYDDASPSSIPIMPNLPNYDDSPRAFTFLSNLTGLVSSPFWVPVPRQVDEEMFMTVGLGLIPCKYRDSELCLGPLHQFIAASANNISFQLPTKMSILQAYYDKVEGVYTDDFPDQPPKRFDYSNEDQIRLDESLVFTEKATKVKKLKFNATVDVILQSTALVAVESHPIHLHGFNFHVLAQGVGNYDPVNDKKKYNLVNPQMRNTVSVPFGGWAVIRFQANNPGVWFMHCHLEAHVPIGLALAFIVEDGPTPSTRLPPPPADYPKC